jgi:hypothetical protein
MNYRKQYKILRIKNKDGDGYFNYSLSRCKQLYREDRRKETIIRYPDVNNYNLAGWLAALSTTPQLVNFAYYS